MERLLVALADLLAVDGGQVLKLALQLGSVVVGVVSFHELVTGCGIVIVLMLMLVAVVVRLCALLVFVVLLGTVALLIE